MPLQEIRSAAGGDLIRNILAALDAAARREESANSSEFKSLVE
jgi:hypothetical protein